MNYNFVYEPNYERIVPAILIDNRASIPEIKNQVGYVIKAYVDSQLALLGNGSITYKVETNLGVLAGFFSINVNTTNKTAVLIMEQLRPAFKGFAELTTQISNFILNGDWKIDYLF